MAVSIRMISVVVPTAKIESCFEPDGLSGYLKKFKKSEIKWNDQHLTVAAYHDPEFVGWAVEYWEKLGLVSVESNSWVDICVVDQSGGATLPCNWLEWDRKQKCVWLKGTDRGEIIGPDEAPIIETAIHVPAKAMEQAEVKVVNSRPWWRFWGR